MRTRLLCIVPELSGGGAERLVSRLASLLPRELFDVHLGLWRDVRTYDLPGDVPVHILHKMRARDAYGVYRRTRRLLSKVEPDVVLSTLYYTNLITGEAIRRSGWKGKWICRIENAPERQLRGPLRIWARRVFRRADRIVGSSRGVSQAAVSWLGLDTKKVCTLYNPVDLVRIRTLAGAGLPFERPRDTFVVTHAGRLAKQKNQRLLLRAFARLKSPAELWILGEGKLKGELAEESSRLGVAERVRWLGFQENPFPLFRAADAFVLSSDWEGMPNSLVEAMACGTAAVSTRCDYGPEELIRNGLSGMLVSPGDDEGMAAALEKLRDHPDLKRRLAAAGRSFVEKAFDEATCVRAYETVLSRGER